MVKFFKFFLFFLPFTFILNVNAETRTINFNSFNTTAESLSSQIQCNSSQCILYNVPFYDYQMSFEWGSTGSPTCSSSSVVSGSIAIDNPSFGIQNNDFSWNRVYIVSNNNTYTCNWFANADGTAFVCNVPSLSSDFKIGYTLNNTFGTQTTFNSIISRTFDINCDTSQSQVIENNNMNTDRIINNDINTSNAIINNQNTNTQNIINNQNSNTQEQIESQLSCNDGSNLSFIPNIRLNANGSTSSANNYSTTDFLSIPQTITPLRSTPSSNLRICFYSSDLTSSIISCNTYGETINIPTNANYFRYSIYNNVSTIYKICYNGNQALTDALTSEDSPDTSSTLDEFNNSLSDDTPITNLLTLPLTLINAYNNGITANCSPYDFGSLLGTHIIFPCIDIPSIIGFELWYIIDSLCCIFLIYSIAMLFVHAFDSLTSLKDDFDDMYVPKHAGKHVGSGVNG